MYKIVFLNTKNQLLNQNPDAVANSSTNNLRVDSQPEFPGGPEALYNDFIKNNYRMPIVKNLKGKVYVSFMVETNGTLSDIKILRDIGYGTGEEAIRVLKLSPRWTPAKRDNKYVRWNYSFPITVNGVELDEAKEFYDRNNTNPISEVIEDKNDVYNTAGIEVKPEFPGGQEALERFLKDNFKNPKKDLKGKVYATFIIEKDGLLSDIKTIRDLGFGTKEEAIRVLKLSPKWNPGKQNEKVVRVLYAMPIVVD
ncbi:energy transducer TonB [Flavobacterium sp. MMS24-S5]|uniref:energy transducer TonB n=1 Tax=Flavobacterium sp. MMS24-S5 TaxID=3416605 RepID=UPI003D05C912